MGNNTSSENERKNEAIRIALRQADLDAARRMQDAARLAEIQSSRREDRTALQRPTDTARNVTSAVNSTVPRTSAVNSTVPRTSAVNSTVPRTFAVNSTVLRTSAVNSTVPRTSEVNSTVPRTSAVNSTVPTTSTVNSTVPKTSAVNSTVTGTSAVNSTVPRTPVENSTISKNSAVSRASLDNSTVLSTTTAYTTVTRTYTVSDSVAMPSTSRLDPMTAVEISSYSRVHVNVPKTPTAVGTCSVTAMTTASTSNNMPITSSSMHTIKSSIFSADATMPRLSVPTVAPTILSPVISDSMSACPSTSTYAYVNEQLRAAIIASNCDTIQPSAPLLSELPEAEDKTQTANQNNDQKSKLINRRGKGVLSTSVALSNCEVPSILLCGACKELMVGNLYFCPNGHNELCATCCLEAKPCPQCSITFVPTDDTRRNFALEEHISKMKIEFTRSQDTNKSHQQREPGSPSSTSRPTAKRNLPSCLLCELCQQLMDGHIYFCYKKHSRLCSTCCRELRPCPVCQCLTIVADDTPRNFALEEQISKMKEKDPGLSGCSGPDSRKLPCDNAGAGCILHFTPAELETHCDDCFFRMVQCPITFGMIRRCQWNGINNELADHIRSEHTENCRVRVNSEAYLYLLHRDFSQLQMIRVGMYNFLMHVQVSVSARHVSWAVALIGTGHAARAWTYEIQLYNKEEPHRKVVLTNACVSDAVPKQQIFTCCSQVTLSHALSYLNADRKLFYKVYIKKK